MNWTRIILDGIAVAAIFNFTIAFLWLIIPNAFCKMLPAEIRKASPPRTKKEIATLGLVMYPLFALVFAYMAISTHEAGISDFWESFKVGYIEMLFVNFGDLIGLDLLFKEKFKDRIMIKGTEHLESWNIKKWMLTLALPEHLILWPLIACPIAGFACAGIGMLLK